MSYNSGSNRARNFKSASRFALVRFWNYSPDYSLNCTPLGPITITNHPRCLTCPFLQEGHFLLAPVEGLFFKPKYRANILSTSFPGSLILRWETLETRLIYCTSVNFTVVLFPFLSSPWGSVYRFLYSTHINLVKRFLSQNPDVLNRFWRSQAVRSYKRTTASKNRFLTLRELFDICTRFSQFLYSPKKRWVINVIVHLDFRCTWM